MATPPAVTFANRERDALLREAEHYGLGVLCEVHAPRLTVVLYRRIQRT